MFKADPVAFRERIGHTFDFRFRQGILVCGARDHIICYVLSERIQVICA